MDVTYHKWHSPNLEQDMELKLYGRSGKPMVVFPTQEGRFFEYEDFGMVDICQPFIDTGKIMLVAVDGIDAQTWTHPDKSVPDRVKRHEAYENHILKEVIPFVQERTHHHHPKFISTGCSMGGYHSANFFFRHPEAFDSLIAISGVYNLKLFIGDYMDDKVYYHTPLAYLESLKDPWYIEQYKHSQIIISVGQGAWEDPMLEDTRKLKSILESKDISCWIDFWGHDVDHDWPWWRKKMSYFLMHLNI